MLTIAEDEVVYKLGIEFEIMEAGTKDSSDTAVPEPPPASPTLNSRKPTSPPSRQKTGQSREPHCQDIDMFAFEFPELRNQYFRLEHITQGVN